MKRRSFAVVALVLWSAAAAAQEAPPEPYVAKFNEGRALVKANNHAEAVDKFKESVALKPAAGTYLNLGDCYERLGRYASAMEAFEKALELAAESKQPEREKEASDRAARLQAMVSSITVTTPSPDATVVVKVDGAVAAVGQPFSVDGGSHIVQVAAACKRARDFPLSVGMKGDARSLAVDPATLEPDPACSSAAPVTGPRPMSTERLLAYVAGGAAVVGLGVGVGFGLLAAGYQDDLEGLCATYPTGCAPARRAQIDETYGDATAAGTISTVGFIGALALVGAGVALYVLSPERRAQSKTASAGPGWVPGRVTF